MEKLTKQNIKEIIMGILVMEKGKVQCFDIDIEKAKSIQGKATEILNFLEAHDLLNNQNIKPT